MNPNTLNASALIVGAVLVLAAIPLVDYRVELVATGFSLIGYATKRWGDLSPKELEE